MKAIIIDDEKKSRNLLQVLIEENCKRIIEIYQAENLLNGVKLIEEHCPQIVFLDIEMPGHSGLEIFDFINKDDYNFEIIFTTAYSEYAIQAIQLSAIDYLLKPVNGSRVKEAADKAINFMGKSKISKRLEELRETFRHKDFKKIGLPVSDGVEFVAFDSIIMMEAEGMYTHVHTTEAKILISKPLKYFADLLQKIQSFYRPHRSYIINIKFIKKYVKSDGGYIIMDNDKMVSISKEKTEEFMYLTQDV